MLRETRGRLLLWKLFGLVQVIYVLKENASGQLGTIYIRVYIYVVVTHIRGLR